MTWVLKHARHGNKPWAVQTAALEACEASGLNKYGYWLEQGLGKTALVLNEFANMDVSLRVVVCPNAFKADWAMAPAEWGMPKIKTGIWPHDTPRNGPMEKSLFAINYEATRRGFSSYKMLEDVLERIPTFLVIDESSFIKNPNSETSMSVMELCKRARHVRLLNGTPQTQNVMDWFAQLKCLGELNGVKSV